MWDSFYISMWYYSKYIMPANDNCCFSFECVRLLVITDQWPLYMENDHGCGNDKIEIPLFEVHISWYI